MRRRYSVEAGVSEQANLIKQLRERTSAPMKDVKAALVTSNWNLEAAYTELRKKGIAGASKKASRIAAEGTLALAEDEKTAAVIEINCETDFVARNEIFQYLALSIARSVLTMESLPKDLSQAGTINPKVLEEMKIKLDHPKLSGETTVQNALMEVAAIMGENVKLRRGFALSSTTGIVSSYLHASPQPGLGRMAGLLTLEAENGGAPSDALQRVGLNVAMHIVASRPQFLSKDHVSTEALEAERDILKTQAAVSGKPQAAIEKMVEGRLRKFVEDVALLEQKFVMNDKVNVKSVLDDLSKEVGQQIKVGSFLRVEVGEGIQRKETDFASEVAAQVG
ncbi:hypothetical protein SUGI_0074470 [Cryptomeria japonica]|nr:hypothetical protein SUGI_0074470 [Cryptomeria japonica]